jgi:hypothetical protein
LEEVSILREKNSEYISQWEFDIGPKTVAGSANSVSSANVSNSLSDRADITETFTVR